MSKKIQFTGEGFENLKKEFAELQDIKRPKAVDRLTKARAMGDLSENSEYTAAKEDLEFISGRMREIEEAIKNAEIITLPAKDNLVTIGTKVTVEINGKQDAYFVVGEFEADPANKKLSQTSPIGKALLGKKKGQSVEIRIPAGKIIYKILNIENA